MVLFAALGSEDHSGSVDSTYFRSAKNAAGLLLQLPLYDRHLSLKSVVEWGVSWSGAGVVVLP